MVNDKSIDLDEGFEPIHEAANSELDSGFHPVELSDEEKKAITKFTIPPKATSGQALREGFAEGGTFGFAPRIGAAMGAGLEKGAGALGLGPQASNKAAGLSEQSLQDLYNEYLDYNNKLQANAKAAHPGMYYTGMIGGGIVSPLNKIGTIGTGGKTAEAVLAAEKAAAAGEAVQTASMPTKMILSGLGGARAGALGGLSQSNDLTDVKQDVEKAGEGMAFGGGVGMAAPPVASTLKAGAGVAGNMLESFFGPIPKTVGQGFRAGLEGSPNLATKVGQGQAQEARADFAKDFVGKLRDIVKSNAKNKVQMIQQHAQDLPKDQVDNVLNEILEMAPSKMGSKEAEEFGQIKEEILRAKEGPMKTETVRQYNPGAQPPPVGAPQHIPKNGEVLPPEGAPQGPPPPMQGKDVTPQPAGPGQQLGHGGPQPVQNPPATQAPPVQGQAEPMGQPMPPSPEGFSGYEAVHKATIDKGDEEALNAFKQKLHEKLLDEESLGKNHNDNPIQIEQQPIPGTDKVRLIAKRAVTEEDGEAFKDQAQQLASKQKEDQRLQALLDKQQEETLKQKAAQEAEMAKPQFQDIQQIVRAGGRNIQNPQELYNLQQLMQEYGNPAAPRMSTKGMQRVAQDASTKLAGVLKKNVGTGDVDNVLHAFNNIGEVLNIDPAQLKLPGGVGEASREQALGQVFKMINPENLSDNDIVNSEKIKYIAEQLKSISPELSESFLDSVQKQAETKGLIKEFTKPYEPTGINPVLNVTRKNASKLGYNAGYNVGQQINKVGAEIGPAIQAGQKIFSQYSPDALNKMASKAITSGDATMQQFGQVLSKLATADERTRNSMIFVLEQQAGYKAMMQKLMEPEKEKTPQMKDKTLQKFK